MRERTKRRLRTAGKWAVRLVVGPVLVLLLVVVGALWLALSSEAAAERILEEVMPRVNGLLPGEIVIEGFSGALRGPLVLDGVRILDERGVPAITASQLRLDWDPGALLRRRVSVAELEVKDPFVLVQVREDGSVNLAAAFVDRNRPKKPKPPREGPVELPVTFHAQHFVLSGGEVRVELPSGKEFRFDTIAADGAWSMKNLDEDFSLKSLTAAVQAPWDSGTVKLRGSGTLETTDLTVDGLEIEWLDNRLRLDGSWPRVGRGAADLAVAIERLALEDIKRFAASAPLGSVVAGTVTARGPLSDLVVTGDLRTPEGGRLELHEAGVRLGSKPLEYRVDAGLTAFPLREVVPIEILPPQLTGKVEWDGSGTALPELSGGGRVQLEPFRLRELDLGATAVRADLADGLLTLHSLASSLHGGEVDLRGTVDLDDRRFALDAAVDVGDLGAVGRSFWPPLRAGRARVQGRQEGSWGGARTSLTLDSDSGLEVAGLDVAGTRIERVTGRVAVDLELPKGGSPELEGTANLVALGLTAGGASFERVQADVVGGGALADVELEVRHRWAARSGDGAEVAEAKPVEEVVDPGGEDADPALRVLRLGARVDWSGRPAVVVDAGRLELDADGARLRATEPFRFVARAGTFALDGLSLDLDPGKLRLTARYDPEGELFADLDLEGFSAVRLRPYLPAVVDLGIEAGLDTLSVDLSGTPAEPELAVGARVREVAVAGRGPLDLALDLRSAGGRVQGALNLASLLALELRSVPLTLRLDGGPAAELAPDGAWDLTLELPERPLTAWTDPAAVELPSNVSGGKVKGRVDWTGTTEAPQVSGAVTLADLEAEGRTIKLSAGAELKGDRFELVETSLRELRTQVAKAGGGGRFALGELLLRALGPEDRRPPPGVPPLGDLQATVEFRRLGLELLHAFVPSLGPLQGALNGQVGASGELAAPALALDLEILGASLGRRRLDELSLSASVQDGTLGAELRVHPQDGGRLGATARAPLPLALDGSRGVREMLDVPGLDVDVRGDGFPLDVALAFAPSFFDAEGAVQLDGKVTGSLMRPVPDLRLQLDPASFCNRGTSVCYERVQVDVALRPGALHVDALKLHTVPQIQNPFDAAFRRVTEKTSGGFEAGGRIELDGWKPARFDLDAKARGMWLTYTPQVQAQVDADIAVAGVYPDLVIESRLDLQDVRVDLGNDELTRDVQATQLPSGLRVHRETSRRGPGEADPGRAERVERVTKKEEGLFQRMELHTDLSMGRNVRVRLAVGLAERIFSTEEVPALKALNLIGNIEPDVRPTGELEIHLVGGVPRISGVLSVDRGSKLGVLSKKFTIQEGSSIEFGGLVPDAVLNLKAIFASRYGDIEVVVGGTVGEPTIDFQSDAFDSRSDMLSVLVTGRPLSELSAAEGNRTMGLVASALGGFLSKMGGKVVPLDTFSVDLGDDMSSGSVEAGKSIGPRVVLITRWRWGTDPGENRIEAQLELSITRGLYLETRIGDALEGSAELVWKTRF